MVALKDDSDGIKDGKLDSDGINDSSLDWDGINVAMAYPACVPVVIVVVVGLDSRNRACLCFF
jgi:hypothetical protein